MPEKILAPARFALLLVVLVLFFVFQFNHALALPPITDDAWMATIAKNWASGFGWASSYGEKYPFDPQITTGPGLLAFISIAIHFFGNAIWLPRVISLLLHMTLYFVFLWQMRKTIADDRQFSYFAMLMTGIFATLHWHMWIVSLGDLSALLYIMNAAVFLFQACEQKRALHFFISGVFAALAILSKLIAIIPAIGLIPCMFVSLYATATLWRKSLYHLLLYLAPCLVLTGVWHLYETSTIMQLSPEQQLLHRIRFTHNFNISGSGIAWFSQNINNPAFLAEFLRRAVDNLTNYNEIVSRQWRLIPQIVSTIVMSLLLCTIYCFRLAKKKQNSLVIFFLLPASFYLIWAILIGDAGYGRYIYCGLYLAACGLCLLLARKIFLSCLLFFYLCINLCFPPLNILYGNLTEWQKIPSPQMLALKALTNEINSKYAKEQLSSCSNIFSREVEYALSGANRLPDCHYLLGELVAFNPENYRKRHSSVKFASEDEMLGHYIKSVISRKDPNAVAPVVWQAGHFSGFYAIENPLGSAYKNFGRGKQYTTITEGCTSVYKNAFYSIAFCSREHLESVFEKNGGINFIPPQWQDKYWLAINKNQ
ncbi:MAG: glycosyltransferase family 39 protein [Pseudomonadales bacterium]|nr:glycosyltransferase family 39 protein [Pseudomonadales bacterium]